MAGTRSEEVAARLVDGIYAAIRFPQTWPDVVRGIGDWLDADIGMMLSPSLPGVAPVPLVAYGLDLTPVLEKFPKHAGRAEFTVRALATGRVPGAFLIDELMSPAEQATSEYWKDLVAPLGVTSGIFCMLRTPDDSLKPVILNFYRKNGKGPYTADDVRDMEGMLPHLRRALGVALDSRASAVAPSDMTGVYEAISAAAFFFGADGKVIHRNASAESLLSERDGVDVRKGKFTLWDSGAQLDLDKALSRVIGEAWSQRYRAGAELLARRPSGAAPLVLIATPVGLDNPISALASPVRCVVFVLEEKLRATGLLTERLQRLYGLTAAEAEIAVGIASGLSLQELADTRGTKLDTVRTQVKFALSKTGARKQADLAALVNRLRF